jgi:hypothetical protein
MHTTEQARTLWCPMVRSVRWEADSFHADPSAPTSPVGGCNSGGKAARSPQGARCIADQCAMWRWSSKDATQARVIAKEKLVLDESSAGERPAGCDGWKFQPCDHFKRTYAQWVQPQSQADANRTGYCGLAGNPVTL